MPAPPVSERWNLVVTLTWVTAFVLTTLSEYRCDFVEFTSTGGASEPIVRQFGVWYYQSVAKVISPGGTFWVETCAVYPSVTVDSSWKAARAFVTLATIGALWTLFSRLFQACSQRRYSPSHYQRNGYGQLMVVFLFTGIFQAFTLLFLDSTICKANPFLRNGDEDDMPGIEFPETCSLATAGKMSISAMVFWIVAGLAAFQEKKAYLAEREARAEARPAGDLEEPLNPGETV